MHAPRSLLAFVSLGALLAAPLAAQSVIVVASGGLGDFVVLQDAVDAASSGDTILVRPGFYDFADTAVIDGKSLVISADGSGPVGLRELVVRNLSAGQSVVLRGLDLGTGDLVVSDAVAGLTLEACLGDVWVEDCRLLGQTVFVPFVGFEADDAKPGLAVSDCDAVTVVRTSLTGGVGAYELPSIGLSKDVTAGGPGLLAVNSRVTLHECVATGGVGGSTFSPSSSQHGEPGGDGLRAVDSSLVLTDVTAVGGEGGDGCPSALPGSCQGGDGLHLEGASVVRFVESSFTAGAGGELFGGGVGLPGDDESVPLTATLVTWPGMARSLRVGSPARENTITTIRYEGEQGDTFGLFFAYAPGYLPLYGKQGVFALGFPFLGPVLVWTVTSPDGVFEVPFSAWDLSSSGLDAVSLYGQCFLAPAAGTALLSSPTALTILDAAL